MQTTALSLLLILLAAFIATAYVLNIREETLIDQVLDEQLKMYISHVEVGEYVQPVDWPHMQMYAFQPGSQEESLVPEIFRNYPPGNHEVDLEDKEFHFVVRDELGKRFILAFDVEQYENSFTELMLILATAFLATLIIALIAIHFVVKRALYNMERLAENVRLQEGSSFLQDGMEEEVAALASALDSYQARQSLLLEREREFSGQLSHELRTPLSVVRAQAEMVNLKLTDPDIKARSQAIMEQVDKMELLVRQLLKMARKQHQPESQRLNLGKVVDRIWDDLAYGRRSETTLDKRIPKDLELNADPLLLELVLRNVMSNARIHANGAVLQITCQNGLLVMADTGGQAALPEERHPANDASHGLGMTILERACQMAGWEYNYSQQSDGTKTTIRIM